MLPTSSSASHPRRPRPRRRGTGGRQDGPHARPRLAHCLRPAVPRPPHLPGAGALQPARRPRRPLRRRFAAPVIEHGLPPPDPPARRAVPLLEDGASLIAKVADKHGCGLAIVDTLNGACVGPDENAPGDIGRAGRRVALDHLANARRDLGASCAARGAAAARAQRVRSDCRHDPKRHSGRRRPRAAHAEGGQMCHGPAGEAWPFTIKPVPPGFDADDEEVGWVSCRNGVNAPTCAASASAQLGPNARTALRLLWMLIAAPRGRSTRSTMRSRRCARRRPRRCRPARGCCSASCGTTRQAGCTRPGWTRWASRRSRATRGRRVRLVLERHDVVRTPRAAEEALACRMAAERSGGEASDSVFV